jgi:2-hydroxy-3-oxopropionate reductase
MPAQHKTVGLMGIGLMGSALAERLLAEGWTVRGYDVDPTRLRWLADRGGVPAASGAEAAEGSDYVVTCLMTGDLVRQAVLGPYGAASAMQPGAALIDVTTCAPDESRRLAEDLSKRGIEMLDAPLSGSSSVARAGELLVLAGGPLPVFEQCKGLLETFGRAIYVGESGAGSTAKLVTNLVLGLNRLALAEGLALGLRAGLQPEMLLEALQFGPAYSRVLDQKGPRMLSGQFEPEARLSQHLKDVLLIEQLGAELGAELPATVMHRRLLEAAVDRGLGELDNSAIFALLSENERLEGGAVD